MIKKNTTQVMVGDVAVGGGAPIVIQSMTNTHTFNKKETSKGNVFFYLNNLLQGDQAINPFN